MRYNNKMDRSHLTPEEKERYSRHLAIPGWSDDAQLRLRAAMAGIAGIGGLGSPVAMYLAAAGVGGLTLCDDQRVERSNLNRQIIYETDDLGRMKVERAVAKLKRLNPNTRVTGHAAHLDTDTVAEIFYGCDLIVDCLDNFSARHVLNQFCWDRGISLVHGGIREYHGQLFIMSPPDTPCLACFLPRHDSNTGIHPVAGPVAGILGALQALETLKLLGGALPVKTGVLHMIDPVEMTMNSVPIPRRDRCPVCGEKTG